MTRTTTWLSMLSCAVIVAACSIGCGSSGPSGGGKAGHGGSAGGGAGAGGGTAGTGNNDGGNMDSKADSAEVNIACVAGGDCTGAPVDFQCTISRTCRVRQVQYCFCAPNNKIACEPCDTVDAGADASVDAGTDSGTDGGSGLPACPANANNPNTTCDTNGQTCALGACNASTHRQQECVCVKFGISNANSRYICYTAAMTCQ